MQDLTHAQITLHTAKAAGIVFCTAETIASLQENPEQQSSLFATAKAAGTLGAKATPQLLPLHHATSIDSMHISLEVLQEERHTGLFNTTVFEKQGIVITAEGKAIGRAGIGMETLTAVSVAALEIFKTLNGSDAQLEIGNIRLLEQKGGKDRKYFSTPPTCAVLVCSDSTAAGMREDNSGKIIMQMLEQERAQVKHYTILPDNKEQIQQQVKEWVAAGIHYIFTTGGTGLGPRDNTVSAVAELLERDADGIAEAMRSYGQQRTPLAMMSRGVAGSIGETLVVTLPGSANGARESLEAILPAVFHARKMMKGGGH